jgi:hypothetical protein
VPAVVLPRVQLHDGSCSNYGDGGCVGVKGDEVEVAVVVVVVVIGVAVVKGEEEGNVGREK